MVTAPLGDDRVAAQPRLRNMEPCLALVPYERQLRVQFVSIREVQDTDSGARSIGKRQLAICPFALLGVQPPASIAHGCELALNRSQFSLFAGETKAAVRVMLRKYHPDRNPPAAAAGAGCDEAAVENWWDAVIPRDDMYSMIRSAATAVGSPVAMVRWLRQLQAGGGRGDPRDKAVRSLETAEWRLQRREARAAWQEMEGQCGLSLARELCPDTNRGSASAAAAAACQYSPGRAGPAVDDGARGSQWAEAEGSQEVSRALARSMQALGYTSSDGGGLLVLGAVYGVIDDSTGRPIDGGREPTATHSGTPGRNPSSGRRGRRPRRGRGGADPDDVSLAALHRRRAPPRESLMPGCGAAGPGAIGTPGRLEAPDVLWVIDAANHPGTSDYLGSFTQVPGAAGVCTPQRGSSGASAPDTPRAGLLALTSTPAPGHRSASGSRARTWLNVTRQVQCLVRRAGRRASIQLQGGAPKHRQIPGTYDPAPRWPSSTKRLCIIYSFNGYLHRANVGDTAALRLPLREHLVGDLPQGPSCIPVRRPTLGMAGALQALALVADPTATVVQQLVEAETDRVEEAGYSPEQWEDASSATMTSLSGDLDDGTKRKLQLDAAGLDDDEDEDEDEDGGAVAVKWSLLDYALVAAGLGAVAGMAYWAGRALLRRHRTPRPAAHA